MVRPLLLCLLLAGCATARPAGIASDVSLPDTFLTALLEGRFDEARAVADRLQASGRIGAALRARLRLGKLTHDAALVRAVASDPHVDLLRADPLAWNELARAVLWTVSVADAAAFLESACEDARLPADNRNRMCTCSYAALGKLAREKPMAVEGEPRTVVDLMTKVPLPIVLASVDGKAPEPFIVDTGASTSILSKAFCDRAGIPYLTRHPQVGRSPGGDVTLFPALVDSIKVGGMTVRNFPAQVMTFPPELEVGGILAPQEALRGLVTEIDGRELKLRLYRDLDEEGWARLVGAPAHTAPLTWHDGGVYLRGRVGASGEAWFIFDTGGGSSTLSSAAAKAIGHSRDENVAGTWFTAGGPSGLFQRFTETMTIGGARPHREEILVLDEPKVEGAGDEVPHLGSIGFPWTLGRRVALSRDGTQLLFTESTYP